MRLSWNEVRARAAAFAAEWKDAHYEKGETQSFYDAFFAIFDLKRRQVASYEKWVQLLDNKSGFIDLFWRGVLLVEQKSAGKGLAKARARVQDYLAGLKSGEFPRYVLLSDFQTFELIDLETGEETFFRLADLPEHVEKFGFILGVEKRTFADQDPVNIQAAELMGAIHDALENSGYVGHDLERFLVRLLFCLFADDTGIFEPRGMFETLIKERTSEDGADAGQWLLHAFQILNTPEDKRQKTLDEDLARLPYVNGQLFEEPLKTPAFDKKMRHFLLEAAAFNWAKVSPAIFGSLFQSVMDKKERRRLGGHYTTEKNIKKVIEPLFLDELRADLEKIKGTKTKRRERLLEFHDKLASLRYLDPACGCGNFLVISYRELRELEIELLLELREARVGTEDFFGAGSLSRIDVDQFYGIEISEFPARIAEVAMWMMDHIMNNRLSLTFGRSFVRIPLKKSPVIRQADALEIDWADVLPPERCSYVLGNPPFGGSKVQTEFQRAQVRRLAALGGTGGTLDYVAAWFIKAGEYVQRGGGAPIGFVATNSITQGEQVAQIWPILFDRYGLEIAFAHRTFAWGSDARGVAHVHVVILGLTVREKESDEKRLFSYDDIKGDPLESRHAALSPYLIDASRLQNRHLVVEETSTPIVDAPSIVFGNMPNDDGNLILTAEERSTLKAEIDERYMPRLIGAHDAINGELRYCLWLADAPPEVIRSSTALRQRLERVREYRQASARARTKELAQTPGLFGEIRHTGAPYVFVPRHSSETRDYVPMLYASGDVIAHDSALFVPNADVGHFGLMISRMHMAWLKYVGGRIKSDFRYSIGIVYNPFPWPEASDRDRAKITNLAQRVLDARAEFPTATLADLYDATAMPPVLRKAHQDLDLAVDRLYRKEPFDSDRTRVEHLFGLYEKLTAPILDAARKKSHKR